MKKMLLSLIGLCGLVVAYSQVDYNKNSLSFSLGSSIPIGNFGSTSTSNKYAGYAKIGEAVNLTIAHKLSRKIALVGTLYGQRNALNTALLAKQYEKVAIPFYYNGNGPNYYPNWSFNKKSWYIGSLLLGLNTELLNTQRGKLSVTAKVLAGLAYVQLPELNGNSKTDTSFLVIKQSSATSFAMAYQVGIGINYKCSNKWMLLANVEYFGTNTITFKNITEFIAATSGGLIVPGYYSVSNSRMPPQVLSQTGYIRQPIGTLNICVGIGLRL
jgi:hypothetical protein